jgi:pantothenate kinase
MPKSLEAHARRGAPFTFDAVALKNLVLKLTVPITAEAPAIYAPSFDHAKRDPAEDDIAILATQRVIIFEGLSFFLSFSFFLSLLVVGLWFGSYR